MTTEKMDIYDWIEKNRPNWDLKGPDFRGYWAVMFNKANLECKPHYEKVLIGSKQMLMPQTYYYATTRTMTVPEYKMVRRSPAKQLKQIRWERSRQPNPKVNTYGERIDRCLMAKISHLTYERDCVDNIRFAELSNRADMRRYRKLQASGCCGSSDTEVAIATLFGFGKDRLFVVGFNYGH